MAFAYDLRCGARISDHYVSSSDDDSWVVSFCSWVMEAVWKVRYEEGILTPAEEEISSNVVSSTDGETNDLLSTEEEEEVYEGAINEPNSTTDDDFPTVEFVEPIVHDNLIE
jgi:hypothetical protein